MHFNCETLITIIFSALRAFPALTCFLLRSRLSSLPKHHHPQPLGRGVSQWSPPINTFRNELRKTFCMVAQVSEGVLREYW